MDDECKYGNKKEGEKGEFLGQALEMQYYKT